MPCWICYRCFLSYDSSSSPVSHKTASIFSVPKSIAFHLRRWSIRSCLFVFFTHVPDVTGVTDCVITLAQKSTRCCKSSLVSLELMGMMSPFLVEGGKSFAQSPSCWCWLLTFFSIPAAAVVAPLLRHNMWHLMATDLLHPPSDDFLLSVFWLLLFHLLMSPLLWKDSEWLSPEQSENIG